MCKMPVVVFAGRENKMLNAKTRKHMVGTFQQIQEQRYCDEKLISDTCKKHCRNSSLSFSFHPTATMFQMLSI